MQLRQQVFEFATNQIAPTYPVGNERGDNQQVKEAVAYENMRRAMMRVRRNDVAEDQEMCWTASVTGLTIFVYHPGYGIPTNHANAGYSPAGWAYIPPRQHEKLSLPSDLQELEGKYIFIYSDGQHHFQAYLNPKKTCCLSEKENDDMKTSKGATDKSDAESEASKVSSNIDWGGI